MENIGTWNSDLLFIFTAALLLPIILYFVNEVLTIIRDRQLDTTETRYMVTIEATETRPEPIKTYPPEKAKPKATPKPKKKTPEPTHNTSPEIMREAIQGLTSLGFRKKEATDSVKGLTKNKSYTDAGVIIQDLFDKNS